MNSFEITLNVREMLEKFPDTFCLTTQRTRDVLTSFISKDNEVIFSNIYFNNPLSEEITVLFFSTVEDLRLMERLLAYAVVYDVKILSFKYVENNKGDSHEGIES